MSVLHIKVHHVIMLPIFHVPVTMFFYDIHVTATKHHKLKISSGHVYFL